MSLLNIFKAPSQNRFTDSIRPHLNRMYQQAYRLTQNQDDAEDLVQEVLLRLYEKKIDLKTIEKPASWLLRSLYNQFINNYRKKSRLPIDDKESDSDEIINTIANNQKSPHQLHQDEDSLHKLQSLISELNPDQQALIALHDIEGHSLSELSEIMDLPLGTLKSRLHRARSTLREQITENYQDISEPFSINRRFSE